MTYQGLKNEVTVLKRSRKVGAARAREIYHMILENEGDIHKTNKAIFHNFGSCQESSYILGHYDKEEQKGNCLSISYFAKLAV